MMFYLILFRDLGTKHTDLLLLPIALEDQNHPQSQYLMKLEVLAQKEKKICCYILELLKKSNQHL